MTSLTLQRLLRLHNVPNRFQAGRVLADPLDGGSLWVDLTDHTYAELLEWLGY